MCATLLGSFRSYHSRFLFMVAFIGEVLSVVQSADEVQKLVVVKMLN